MSKVVCERDQAVKEQEKKLEAFQIKFNLDLQGMCDAKDKEIVQLQSAVTSTYQDLTKNQQALQMQIYELTAQLASSQKLVD